MTVQGVFLVAILFYLACMELVKGQLREGCEAKCGNVAIEFPFGISEGCYYAEDPIFKLTCDQNKLLFKKLEVVDISYNSQLRVLIPRSYACFDSNGTPNGSDFFMVETLGNFTLSEKNMLTAVGCNTFAFLTAFGRRKNSSVGCTSLCDSIPEQSTPCDGVGCCQNPVPVGSNRFITSSYLFTYPNSTPTHANSCNYAFLVENGTFKFNAGRDFKGLLNATTKFPVLLDWSIRGCSQSGIPLCVGNSTCSNSTNGMGVICKCKDGYYGNPYLKDGGCQDIDECSIPAKNTCLPPSTCVNTRGNFFCTSNDDPKYVEWTKIFLSTTIGFLVIVLVFSCIRQRIKHRKDTELRQHFFEQNGGGMLIQRLSGAGSSNVDVQIFTEDGMKTATDGYDESRILGQGGQGTVYKGLLPDNSIVAIKKARLGDNSQVEQFINEVLVLSQINHRNVVKLMGCCLETEVPLLVYEFIKSGTLFDHLHGSLSDSSLTWEQRLRIATEVAGTLAYLHSSASIPIIHRDVKTANILLDENLTAKVADFGASRLIPTDKEQLTTMVQGTLGYLDPEYYNTGLLNEKSDVYSFGVVLMELLTGQKALCFERPQKSTHLVSYFGSARKENRLHEVIDDQVMYADNQKEIQEAARIAVECTRLTGEERPRMKEVAADLEGLRATKTKHKWSDDYNEPEEDAKHLLGVGILSAEGETSSIGYDSIKNVAILDIEAGR